MLYHSAGTDQVVLGDLVYCKEQESEKVEGDAKANCEDENLNDAYNSHVLDEISSTDIPEANSNLVKVCCSASIYSCKIIIRELVSMKD